MTLQEINEAIKLLPENEKELVSDGYHTFKELYAHRVALFVALCNRWNLTLDTHGEDDRYAWKSMKHADGTMYEGWFIAGLGLEKGETITYHLPMSEWEKFYSPEITNAPEWDGHTSDDVIQLLYKL